MAATKITDLLPIPAEVRAPHAYQIFGLADGEQDGAKIAEAVQSTVARLKAAKSSTDAKLWGTAARLVQEARVTLADPDKKAQLDARFGIIAMDDGADAKHQGSDPLAALLPTVDPLAALLPRVDPLAAVLPSANPLAPVDHTAAQNTLPRGPFAAPLGALPASVVGTPADPSAASIPLPTAPLVVKPKRKRRKKSVFGMLVFSAFALGMFGLIAVLGYFLLYEKGRLAITNKDGQISISTKPAEADPSPQVSRGGPVPEQRTGPPADPVMGSLAGDMPVPTRGQEPDSLANAMQAAKLPGEDTPSPPMVSAPAEPVAGTEPGAPSEPMPDPPAMEPLTEDMIADAAQTLERLRKLIREANWKEMKAAAEVARETRMTEPQTAETEALFELADLATYYRGGIERAVAALNVGNDFEVTDTFRVIVVEKGEDRLVVRYSEKNKTFTFDEFPFVLAHKLASFEMPASPSTQAGKAAYQAIAPKATQADREEAIGWLRAITEQVEGADPKRMADTIETLFSA